MTMTEFGVANKFKKNKMIYLSGNPGAALGEPPAPAPTAPATAALAPKIVFLIHIIATAVLVLAIGGVTFGLVSLVKNNQGESFFNPPISFEESSLSDGDVFDSAFWRSGKLIGAVESVDEYGVVHGTSRGGINYRVYGRGTVASDITKVKLCAVGDIIMSDNDNTMALTVADAYSGSIGDGKYSITPFFSEVQEFIRGCDLRYVNQETVMAGGRLSGWPTFNSPDECAQGLVDVGFNIVNFCSNHLYDKGISGLLRSIELWDTQYPDLLVAGSYASLEERQTVQMIEVNGINFAVLAYTYGDNTYGAPANFPNNYNLVGFNKEEMHDDIVRAKQVADLVVVSMHWGTEYTASLNNTQRDYAQFLADEEVDLVIGTHAHCVQPVKFVTGQSGKVVPVVYGLGDFVAGWSIADTIFGGVFYCEFVRDGVEVSIKNLMWYPTIEWSALSRADVGAGRVSPDVRVRFLKDMTIDEINANTRVRYLDERTQKPANATNIYPFLKNLIDGMGMEIPVIM
ncbi:MAG: CapA family protein [Eggerthellaceae bacterium]|nr:CapA family protein [Eggerthellaceae bacterium]